MQIHPHDRLLVQARRKWKDPPTKHRYNKYRPTVERLIAHLVANGHRKLRYRGTTRNRQQLHTRAAAINLRRLINLGLHPTNTERGHQPHLKPGEPQQRTSKHWRTPATTPRNRCAHRSAFRDQAGWPTTPPNTNTQQPPRA